jgi:TolB-like protein/Tfp pilus assembly protein PilF
VQVLRTEVATDDAATRAQRAHSIRAWASRQTAGRVAATAALAALLLAGVAFGLMHGRPSRQNVVAASDSQHPSWDSPRLPSRPAPESLGRSRGIVAIAVMPFTNLGESGERSDRLAEMITDDLTHNLSRIPPLRVISRQTASTYRGQDVDPSAVGAELGVRYLLEGTVSMRAGSLTVNVELVETSSRNRVWSGRFERTDAERHVVQDEIVNGLARELQVKVNQAEADRNSQDPDVHELVFKGWAAINAARKIGVDALRTAETHFAEALARDPDNARAQHGLAAYHAHMAVQLFAPDPAPHLATAETMLQRLIDRYPDWSGTYTTLGLVQVARNNYEAAARSFERDIELNPSHALAYAQLGRALTRLGRPEEGLEHVRYAIRLSPRDPALSYWLAFAGFAELEMKRYPKAIDYLERALVLNPGQPRTTLTLVAAHALAGSMQQAHAILDQLQKRQPHLSREKLIKRAYGNDANTSPQLGEGLRLALAPRPDPWASPRRPATATAGAPTSLTPIAVLPFTTYGDTAGSLQLTADMIGDDLTNMLSRVSGLRVISRQTMRTYQGQPIDVAALGAELGVRYVLEGSMRMRDAKVRVNVELIDPKTRSPVWSARIERDHGDHHGVQDEIVGRVARELQFGMYQVESEVRSADHDAAALAYRGWAAMWNAFSQSHVETFRQAEGYFTQALARDPQYFSAQVGLGAYHVNVGAQQIVADAKPHLARAGEILQDAIRRRPNHSGAHFYMGLVHSARGQLPEALDCFERAVDLNPSMASAHAHIGHALARMGRADEGLEHLRYAMRLSPRDPNLSYWLQFAGNAELQLGNHAEAIDNYRRSTAMNPHYPRSLAGLAAAHALSGNLDEARVYAAKLRQESPQLSVDELVQRFARPSGSRPSPLREGLQRALSLESH